ncbi:protein FAM115C [Clonorchis sinensis]|uniref:Protein FAM115C n=1 Tax=Clonorchis sinensis TaxID=79923 RepID=G7YSM2_CLOSI|nr:protein FAM115C [Clonorchis sinensis]
MRINSTYDPGDVLLITRDDQFDVEKVYQLLESGTNSVLAGYPGRDTNDSLTQLLKKMKVEFVKTTVKSSSRYIVVADAITSHKYIPISYDIARYVDSWKAFSTESYKVEVSYLGVKDEDTDKELKRLVDKYGPLMERIGPCPANPYEKKKDTELAVRNYNALLKYQYGGTNFALPNINHHPGLIPNTVKSTTVVATVYADQAGNFFPLGVYANAGGVFKWTVVKNNRNNYKDQRLRINAHVDSIVKHEKWSRWPSIATDFPLSKQGQYVSPHGGALFLQLPRGVNITIRLEGVYRYPWLDLRNPKSIESFPQELKDYAQPPFLAVHGDSMITMLKTFDVYEGGASEVTSSARHFDNAIKVMDNYRGTKWEDVRSEVFVADIQISGGYGHSGYPIMGSIDWSHLFTLWSSSIKRGGQPGFVHEIGHNLQVGEATLLNGGEVTNNIYRLIVDEINLGLNPYKGDMGTGQWSAGKYQGPSWGYYRYLGKLFGHGLVGNGFIEARKKRPGSESQKTHFWVKQMCIETGCNMLPFHDMWHFPVSNDVKSTCTKLPCFSPRMNTPNHTRAKLLR